MFLQYLIFYLGEGAGGGIWSKEGDMEYIGGKYGVQRRGYKVHMGGGIRVHEYGVQRKRR